jgi:hypothetical protein
MTGEREALYLGFAKHGNLGDDAIRDAYVFASGGALRLTELPVGGRETLRSARDLLGYRRRHLPVLFGGGTALGRPLWRQQITLTRWACAPSSWTMLGAGVEDPDFLGDRAYSSWEEIRRWADVLAVFPEVTVRGPRGQEILACAGIESVVVGDPALLHSLDPAISWDGDGRDIDLLVNITCGEDQWGGTALDWTPTVTAVVGELAAAGLRVAFVALEPGDDPWNARVQSGLLTEAQVFRPRTVPEYLTVLNRTRCLLGTRLHANVLAAAAGVASVSLEYRPKCRDFMQSIRQQHRTFRVDRLDHAELIAALTSTLDDVEAVRAELRAEVGALTAGLRSRVDALLAGFPSGGGAGR